MASIGGSKTWVLDRYYGNRFMQLPKYLDIKNSRSLVTAGKMTSSLFIFRRVSSKMGDIRGCFDIECKLFDYGRYKKSCPSYAMCVDSHNEEVTGIAVFDRDPLPVAKCFFVALQSRTIHGTKIAMQQSPRIDTTRVENVKDIGDRDVDDNDGKRLESKRAEHSCSGTSEETKASHLLPGTNNRNDPASVDEASGRWALEEGGSASSHIDDDKIVSRQKV
jgi:hypothetical protein